MPLEDMSALTPVSIYGRDYKVEKTPLWLLKAMTKPAKIQWKLCMGLLEHLLNEGITLPPTLPLLWNAVMMDSDLAASGTMR